jgi:holo-[acyl-carrier protein] synthase
MDIVGIGTHLVECHRIRRLIERHAEVFLTRYYTTREISDCNSSTHTTEQFASRWAAKEAVLRCVGLSNRRLAFTDIEIRLDRNGQARVAVCGAVKDHLQTVRIGSILLSLSQTRLYAVAFAIALRLPPPPDLLG